MAKFAIINRFYTIIYRVRFLPVNLPAVHSNNKCAIERHGLIPFVDTSENFQHIN